MFEALNARQSSDIPFLEPHARPTIPVRNYVKRDKYSRLCRTNSDLAHRFYYRCEKRLRSI